MGRVLPLAGFMLVSSVAFAIFENRGIAVEAAAQGQGTWRPMPAPQVTAAGEPWLLNREPIFYAGEFYYPAGPTVFFDGRVMAPVGFHRGVPLYENTSEIPFTVIYVPVGDNLMRPYARRRDSLAPTPNPDEVPLDDAPLLDTVPVGTAGVDAATQPIPGLEESAVPAARTGRSRADVWIEWQGSRWYLSGPAVPFEPAAFVQVGTYHGLPLYKSTRGGEELFVTMVPEGPLAPFKKR
jgi:hypothetical protein